MKTPKAKPKSRRAPRPVRVPPPLTRGSEKFEGSSVLSDFGGDLGILLWQSLRNVLLWNTTEAARRKGLFTPGADEKRRVKLLSVEVDDVLRSPLAVLARLLADPAGADRKRVAAACQKIGEWAEERGALATALAYIQAAALTSDDARLSYEVGRLARKRAEYPRAETWFRRAILLGRRSGDWDSYSRAFVGLGNLYRQRGNLVSAQRAYLRAFRASRRKGLREVQGRALHELFGIAAAFNEVQEAKDYAQAAFKAYGPKHRNIPGLATDVAGFWADLGYYFQALPVFQAVLSHVETPRLRMIAHANTALAAGELGEREMFEDAWKAAWEFLEQPGAETDAASVLFSLARGAAALGDWERAKHAGERAEEIAKERKETKILERVALFLEAAREHRLVEAPSAEEADEKTDLFATNLLQSLNGGLAVR